MSRELLKEIGDNYFISHFIKLYDLHKSDITHQTSINLFCYCQITIVFVLVFYR